MNTTSIQLIQNRLKHYEPSSKQEELNAIKEIYQEIVLSALSRTDFFKHAAFQGGTCLRIFYNLPRFSEDLDFILLKPIHQFAWSIYLKHIQTEFSAYGIALTVKERGELEKSIRMAFLKQDSLGELFTFTYPRNSADTQKIMIRLEIDVNPPGGSKYQAKILKFPFASEIITQDLGSSFAGKCHALLCRPFVKGRDWYDFIWYISRRVIINGEFLKKALFQMGPWKEKKIFLSQEWLVEQFHEKINQIDWKKTQQDVSPFLKSSERQALGNWSRAFFIKIANQIEIES